MSLKREMFGHVALTLWDTSDEHHCLELSRMKTRCEWEGMAEGKEKCPESGRWHLYVCVQTHHPRRKRIASIWKWFENSDAEMQWSGRVWIGKVRCKRGHFKCLKKDGDWNTTGAIFTDDNRKGEQHADNHELWCAIQDEGIHCLKELRKHFPNQMARSENLARKLINDITPMRPPESVDSEFLWQKELRCELAQPDNGREIMTIHSGQTHQGKSVMMDHLDCECA